jgi:hypothetical protein
LSAKSLWCETIADVVKDLVEVLSSQVVLVIGGVQRTSEVRAWINGQQKPIRESPLRYALEAVNVLREEGPEVTRAWFGGTNRHFNGNAPARVLRDGPDDVGPRVVAAARAFIE